MVEEIKDTTKEKDQEGKKEPLKANNHDNSKNKEQDFLVPAFDILEGKAFYG